MRSILSTKTQIVIYLFIFAFLDAVIPIPITAMVLIMVLFQKPAWFRDWVDEVYRRWILMSNNNEELFKQRRTADWNECGKPVSYWPSDYKATRLAVPFFTKGYVVGQIKFTNHVIIKISDINTDTLRSFSRYHINVYSHKNWPFTIIFSHRQIITALKFAWSLEHQEIWSTLYL